VRPLTSMRRCLSDPDLFGREFGGASWAGWRVLLIAMLGEPLLDDERVIFKALTGREREPLQRVEEFWGAIGRRGGKSRAIALLVVYISLLVDHSANLVVGERGVVLVLAQNVRQARIVFGYAVGVIENVQALRGLVANKTAEVITLTNGLDIEIRAASFRGLRGVTCVCAIADEISFWFDDTTSNPDEEIIGAIRPSLSTTGGMLVAIGSPHARRGELWRTYQRHFGADGDPLIMVAQGASRDLNPSLPQAVVDRALELDEAVASAEYLAQFRRDLEAFVIREVVEACVSLGVRERPPLTDLFYSAFCDPSGGSSDAMTLAIAHKEADVVIIDAVRERRPPFSPDDVVSEFAALLRSYRCTRVVGDRYGGEWPRERFREHDVTYEASAAPKSDLYRDALPLLNARRIDLVDNPRLVSQLVGLERRTARSGRDSIDHGPGSGSHDDVANCVAGVAGLLATGSGYDHSMNWVGGPEPGEAPVTWDEMPYFQRIGGLPW
jgi:hypothetical protein